MSDTPKLTFSQRLKNALAGNTSAAGELFNAQARITVLEAEAEGLRVKNGELQGLLDEAQAAVDAAESASAETVAAAAITVPAQVAAQVLETLSDLGVPQAALPGEIADPSAIVATREDALAQYGSIKDPRARGEFFAAHRELILGA